MNKQTRRNFLIGSVAAAGTLGGKALTQQNPQTTPSTIEISNTMG